VSVFTARPPAGKTKVFSGKVKKKLCINFPEKTLVFPAGGLAVKNGSSLRIRDENKFVVIILSLTISRIKNKIAIQVHRVFRLPFLKYLNLIN
jgi:hypothetical protein